MGLNRLFPRFAGLVLAVCVSQVYGVDFFLVTGVDATLAPGTARPVTASPGPNTAPGLFVDGDRLAGTSDVGLPVAYLGTGSPLVAPNEFGSLSFTFQRGTIPAGPGVITLLGINYLGGPLVDLDGNLGNGSRSLIPVTGMTPVLIPATQSRLALTPDFGASTLTIVALDATGSNEGVPGMGPDTATTINTLAGTAPDATPGAAINPTVDTRVGTLMPYTGSSGTLVGVYRIEDLGFEWWQDSLLQSMSTGPFLGTFQYLDAFRGWLVVRDPGGSFPTLGGEALGSTLWPAVDASAVGLTFNTAHGAPTATIAAGTPTDVYTAPGNGGLSLTDFGGDLGAYLSSVVVPALAPGSTAFIYLEAAGFGINNSFDPVFGDRIAYDVVVVAESDCVVLPGGVAGDSDGNGLVDSCELAVPTVSEWGAGVMVLLLVTAGTIVFRRLRVGDGGLVRNLGPQRT